MRLNTDPRAKVSASKSKAVQALFDLKCAPQSEMPVGWCTEIKLQTRLHPYTPRIVECEYLELD
jgi:hypothetical protein